VHPQHKLVVAANRDELIARPAISMTQLEDNIWGGKDLLAGGTWLAVNANGVWAGLTNLPSPMRDVTKKSRGELPLALARHDDAKSAVTEFVETFSPREYNPAWLLVGDGESLFYIDMTDGGGRAPALQELPPGIHVLENRKLGVPSPKADYVRERMKGAMDAPDLVAYLHDVLRDHHTPPRDDDNRPQETYAACVHAGPYGTRSSTIIIDNELYSADGRPCTTPFTRVR
jgi:uncharacterized protein with NRDE domain